MPVQALTEVEQENERQLRVYFTKKDGGERLFYGCVVKWEKREKTSMLYSLADQEAPASVNTVFGNVLNGSILSYQLKDLKEDAVLFSID